MYSPQPQPQPQPQFVSRRLRHPHMKAQFNPSNNIIAGLLLPPNTTITLTDEPKMTQPSTQLTVSTDVPRTLTTSFVYSTPTCMSNKMYILNESDEEGLEPEELERIYSLLAPESEDEHEIVPKLESTVKNTVTLEVKDAIDEEMKSDDHFENTDQSQKAFINLKVNEINEKSLQSPNSSFQDQNELNQHFPHEIRQLTAAVGADDAIGKMLIEEKKKLAEKQIANSWSVQMKARVLKANEMKIENLNDPSYPVDIHKGTDDESSAAPTVTSISDKVVPKSTSSKAPKGILKVTRNGTDLKRPLETFSANTTRSKRRKVHFADKLATVFTPELILDAPESDDNLISPLETIQEPIQQTKPADSITTNKVSAKPPKPHKRSPPVADSTTLARRLTRSRYGTDDAPIVLDSDDDEFNMSSTLPVRKRSANDAKVSSVRTPASKNTTEVKLMRRAPRKRKPQIPPNSEPTATTTLQPDPPTKLLLVIPKQSDPTTQPSSTLIAASSPVPPPPPITPGSTVDNSLPPQPAIIEKFSAPQPAIIDKFSAPQPATVDDISAKQPTCINNVSAPKPATIDNLSAPQPVIVDNTLVPQPVPVGKSIAADSASKRVSHPQRAIIDNLSAPKPSTVGDTLVPRPVAGGTVLQSVAASIASKPLPLSSLTMKKIEYKPQALSGFAVSQLDKVRKTHETNFVREGSPPLTDGTATEDVVSAFSSRRRPATNVVTSNNQAAKRRVGPSAVRPTQPQKQQQQQQQQQEPQKQQQQQFGQISDRRAGTRTFKQQQQQQPQPQAQQQHHHQQLQTSKVNEKPQRLTHLPNITTKTSSGKLVIPGTKPRFIYSSACTKCIRIGREAFCNKQLPCDICVAKKFKNCHYPGGSYITNKEEVKEYEEAMRERRRIQKSNYYRAGEVSEREEPRMPQSQPSPVLSLRSADNNQNTALVSEKLSFLNASASTEKLPSDSVAPNRANQPADNSVFTTGVPQSTNSDAAARNFVKSPVTKSVFPTMVPPSTNNDRIADSVSIDNSVGSASRPPADNTTDAPNGGISSVINHNMNGGLSPSVKSAASTVVNAATGSFVKRSNNEPKQPVMNNVKNDTNNIRVKMEESDDLTLEPEHEFDIASEPKSNSLSTNSPKADRPGFGSGSGSGTEATLASASESEAEAEVESGSESEYNSDSEYSDHQSTSRVARRGGSKQRKSRQGSSNNRSLTTVRICTSCAATHKKCDKKPTGCSRCVEKNINCVYPTEPIRRRRRRDRATNRRITVNRNKSRNESEIEYEEKKINSTRRMLKELDYEKRDLHEILGGERGRRQATRQNYKLIDQDDDDDPDNAYGDPNAEGEFLILSDDEIERRKMLGTLPADFYENALV
ncbi:hypothetical protein CANARDRAFT_6268 [[Candida] arabinofermentans NRRL YB-2248]|uniref:Zn(2)-C6 fungal-type domain-containing protein n=1 Tax=[Candida] arabinofermentans NRRL YB-2248 TaxID=983967 RepID=A0A1E4T4P4_9ASCO|nr:hypothetical protein CANARDRAFT_6268 [[Candida] arabinofermentans NRRL YB-2248]